MKNQLKNQNQNQIAIPERSQYNQIRWKNEVLERDDYTCQLCGCNDEDAILHAHHIKKHSEYEYLRNDINNGITLCNKCHNKIFGREEEYEDIFIDIIIKGILKRFGK